MRRFYPYFAYLKGVRSQFITGILSGLIFAALSGFGLPLMIKVVFPIIFSTPPKTEAVRAIIEKKLGPEEGTRLLTEAFGENFFGPSPKVQQVVDIVYEKLNEKDGDKILGEVFGDSWQERKRIAKVHHWFADRFGEKRAVSAILIAACSLIPLVALLRGIAGFVNVYFMTSSGLHVLRELQQSVFVKIQRLPLGFFSGQKTGDLISRVITDTNMLQAMLTTISNDLVKQPFTLVAAIGYLGWQSYQSKESFFVLACLLSIPLAVIPIRMIGKRLMRKAAGMQREAGDNSAILAETLGATREIRAFNLEDMMGQRFLDGIGRWTKYHLKVIKYRYLTPPLIEMIAAGVVAAALGYGATKGITLDKFLPLVAALYMCYDPMKKLGEIHTRITQGEASLDRLEVILHAEEGVTDPVNPVTLPQISGNVSFRNVSFSYGDNPALHGVDVEVPAGQIVALVGSSGAGKTTFASMIPRFYDPVEGEVSLDGIDLRQLRLKDLRSHITLVPQEAVLFSGTIAENIGLGRIGASHEEIVEAAKHAYAHDFVLGLPAGYDTQVGERGAQLSGGQKQRISIARAFLKNAPVLILDEATAALDSESESRVQDALGELAKGRTTFIIAHRFSTIRIADRILVFDGGRIVGDGTFEELKASHAIFQNLLAKQSH
jgi:subfamily B ATP-binding cassette protein MsbA